MNPKTKHTISIDNAGLVILNPFLVTLFSRLNYLEKETFVDSETQLRAAQLLTYIITGTTVLKEANLGLNKVLCGLADTTLFPADFFPTEEETAVTESCLTAVLQRWDKLKNTSLPGFRESFLKRDGELLITEATYQLHVEQRGYDVLLQTIPWQISMIKLPWMKEMLSVEWL